MSEAHFDTSILIDRRKDHPQASKRHRISRIAWIELPDALIYATAQIQGAIP